MSVAIHVDQERDTQCLGASEAAGVLGLDKYNPPIKIWRRHRGLDVDDRKPGWLAEAADWGQILEPVIRGKYAVLTSSMVFVPTFSAIRDGWLRCTPDGIVATGSLRPAVQEVSPPEATENFWAMASGLVQCKNVDAHLSHEWQDGPPPAKEVQVRVEMAVTGMPWCDLAALIGGNKYVQYRVERDLDIEARILRDLRSFWALVETGVEPTIDHTDAWRLHISERMPTARMIGEASGEDADAMDAFRRARADRKRADADEGKAKNEILLRMSVRGITALKHPTLGTLSAYRAKNTWALRSPPQWGDE